MTPSVTSLGQAAQGVPDQKKHVSTALHCSIARQVRAVNVILNLLPRVYRRHCSLLPSLAMFHALRSSPLSSPMISSSCTSIPHPHV